MDRAVDRKVLRKERRKKIIRAAATVAGLAAAIAGITVLLEPRVSESDIILYAADRGDIAVSVSASGKVAPAFEEIVNSPISSRILEVCRKSGDAVEEGTPVLRLDLQSVETDYKKMLDEEQMKVLTLERLRISNRSQLSEMEMNLKVRRMELSRKEVELRNERYLDSLGSGTTDKVRQAELSFNVGKLQLKEEEQKFENQKALIIADEKVKELELNIFRKELAEMKRTLEDAQIRSPRSGVLTFVNTETGARVEKGEKIAIVSDLSHFKVEGEIADAYGDRIAVGTKALVKLGTDRLDGVVSNLTPLSRNGVLSFSVRLDDDRHPRLRSGLKVDVYVMNAVKENVLRIGNGGYYAGPGEYDLYVRKGNELVKRKVKLGECNFEFVEAVSGLEEGEQVLISDMEGAKGKNRIRLKP